MSAKRIVCYRRCWSCMFDEDINHPPCDGDATDDEDIDAWHVAQRALAWLRSLGPIPIELPPDSHQVARRPDLLAKAAAKGMVLPPTRPEPLYIQTPWGGVRSNALVDQPRPSHPCGCWCVRPDLYNHQTLAGTRADTP